MIQRKKDVLLRNNGIKNRLSMAVTLLVEAICALTSFLLACLLMLNYYYNCSTTDCEVHKIFGIVYSFDFDFVFPLTSGIHFPYMFILFFECAYLFFTAVVSFGLFRALRVPLTRAVFESMEFGLTILIVFELGIYFIDPNWWTAHVTSFLYPLTIITNENLLIVALASLAFLSGIMHLSKRTCANN